ncbi:DUF1569 domain-containing protein [Streptomyces sp. NPDC054884]|uniref:DUF1569 domain-containing protein n=1 Tax=Streptomyces sp. ME08-AFT2 TaxID=3028683 RepID=UPI0029A61FA8|nr:DUF1569 domain-containing protein [Streptomyces sp. ME08-AFT2]MDX3310571.1 DUF1569 domain-containing protein [Streptomyces sp. ME08-AFT2]
MRSARTASKSGVGGAGGGWSSSGGEPGLPCRPRWCGWYAPHPAYGRCTHDEFARLHAMPLAEHLPGLVDA